MKTAIIHEWLTSYVGSERVLEQIVSLYPESDLYALLDFIPENEKSFLFNKKVRTSFLQKLPFAEIKYRSFLPIMPYAVSRFDVSGYDVVISNAHAVAKGVKTSSSQLHICYCHTPMRYAWDLQDQYLKESGLNKGLKGALARSILSKIKKWDIVTSKRVNHFLTNSHYIQDRIKRAYGRDSTVIYPPVDTGKFELYRNKEDFYLTVSRMVPYKKVDLIVQAFSELGLPLVVIGDGPDFEKVKNRATSNVKFLGFQKDDVVKEYMQKARAFIFAAEEDFGIVPVEAQACGTPVIAFGKGGATETVIPLENAEQSSCLPDRQEPTKDRSTGKTKPTGIFFYKQTPSALIDAVKKFISIEDTFNPQEIRRNAERFGIERFRREFKDFMDEKISDFFR